MILRTVSSKNTTLYYVQKSFRQENGKNATKYVERLGNLEQLKARFGEGYIPTYTRTDLTNNLHGSAGFRTDTQIVTKKAAARRRYITYPYNLK